ncbi:MAG: hypothetical protein ACLP1Y_06960 [Candidatus Acidiferrales bacterium]
MDCKRAGKILTELALTGATPADSSPLAKHLAACSVCGEAFAREQAFVAEMNRGLVATVAGEPSPALRARVREQLATPARRWEWRWAVVAAAGLLAVGISMHALHSRQTGTAHGVPLQGGEIAVVTPPAVREVSAPALVAHNAISLARRPVARGRGAFANLPPVLIEKGEREATLRFLSEVRDGRVDPVSLTAQKEPREVAQLEIVPLDLPVLADTDSWPNEDGAR